MYVKVTNGTAEKYTIGQLRRDNPQVSFPKTITDAVLSEFNVYPLTAVERPSVDYTKNVSEGPFEIVNGNWSEVWVVTDASQEQISQRLAEQWGKVRGERNARLSACDWTQLSDASVDKAAWGQYRQELRDLPENQSDPFNIVWPIGPLG